MVCIFFRTSGVDLITYWDRGGCVDHKTYIDDCLKPLVRLIKTSRKTLGTKKLKFHHDNARPHVHQAVITYLKEQGFTLMGQPPYSPDLAPSDFWLFDYIKQGIGLFRQIYFDKFIQTKINLTEINSTEFRHV